ncbi:hypothetical protein MKT60_016590 [Providencia rettgeri]|uniref:hypothetical protein n=1 Tax=Providencia TaxID=586 RepID=UPI001EE745EB|nr:MULTISPECIES: hypothetical protein [Providencia]EMC8779159.1 hypothetical protein [Providencia rettgeri]MCG5369081.1 hypothetical protein [Providencia rettgeri]MCL0008471.1 hypothetical protein [Providencia rettgeri]
MKYTLLLLTTIIMAGCQGKSYSELTPAEKAEVRAAHDKNAKASRKCNRVENQSKRTDCFLDRNDEGFNRLY